MDFYFLGASTPIAKRYELDTANHLIKHPYPFVSQFTSFREQPKSLEALTSSMQHHAALGRCVLKGTLSRDLANESRAGATDRDRATDWICLDLDGIKDVSDVDSFLNLIGCSDVSYIRQWSSSMGLEGLHDLRCHIFMRLSTSIHPQLLKHWLIDLNLRVPLLNNQLTLTKTNNSLKWPLDITTCQNDKLLYIAPPIFSPEIPDPFPSNRIEYFPRARPVLIIANQTLPGKEALRVRTDEALNRLREAAGLSRRKQTKYKYSGEVEYVEKPDTAIITEKKTERGFTYFNLNGGDSWAYYHPIDNPRFIFNFKGEPAYRTEDLLPEYWAELQRAGASGQANSSGRIYLAFREFRSSAYWNGTYDASQAHLELAPAKTHKNLTDFLKSHGQPVPDTIHDWEITFDPHSTWVVDSTTRKINRYKPSTIEAAWTGATQAQLPPITQKIISHALGNDHATVEHFLNWLACVIQYKDRTQTAWVLHGTEGTGKGIMFHNILRPILGHDWTVIKRFEELESEFTDFVEHKFITAIDEMESGSSLYHSKITAKLKNLIVEPVVNVRRHYLGAYETRNYNNMLFFSNKPAPVVIAPDDRRFNVGVFQENRLQITTREIEEDLVREIPEVYAYFRSRVADRNLARTPLINASRSQIISINRQSIDIVIDALNQGDLEFFWDQLPFSKDLAMMDPKKSGPYLAYKNLIIDLVMNQTNKLSRDDLYALCEYCVGNMPASPNKFTTLLKHHRVHPIVIWKGQRAIRGIEVKWQTNPAWLAQAKLEIQQNLV